MKEAHIRVITIIDKYSPEKRWIIKRYPSGNYYWTQDVCGKQIYPFRRTTKRWIKHVLEDMAEEL